MLSRFQFGGASEGRSYWTVLGLLLLAVLLPTAVLLYVINETVSAQRETARQKLGDAYRGQLRLVSERIDAFWEQRARDLDARGESQSPAIFFEHCVRDKLADFVICLRADGSPAYPSLAEPPKADPTLHDAHWVEARTLEDNGDAAGAAVKYDAIAHSDPDPQSAGRASAAYFRCLLKSAGKRAVVRAVEERSNALAMSYSTGLDGRLIYADELRLALEMAPPEERTEPARQLFSIVQNYAREMPSSQRLFLMDALRSLQQETRFRTQELEKIRPLFGGDPFSPDSDRDRVYHFPGPNRRRMQRIAERGALQ